MDRQELKHYIQEAKRNTRLLRHRNKKIYHQQQQNVPSIMPS